MESSEAFSEYVLTSLHEREPARPIDLQKDVERKVRRWVPSTVIRQELESQVAKGMVERCLFGKVVRYAMKRTRRGYAG